MEVYLKFVLCVLFIIGYIAGIFGQLDLCPNTTECHCYDAWEQQEVIADCYYDVMYLPDTLPANLTHLRISQSDDFTTILSDDFNKYPDLTLVELYENGLNTIKNGAFSGLSKMEQLYITFHYNLATLPSNILSSMTGIQLVDLQLNAFSSKAVFDIFQSVTSLRFIRLDGNPINDVLSYAAFVDNTQLEFLHVSNCQILGIDADAFQNMNSLKSLCLDGNQIHQLSSSSLNGLANVEYLNLAMNGLLQVVDNTFSTMASLLELDLSNNNISTIQPDAFKGLDNLHTLFLNLNNLNSVPSTAIKALPNLHEINLSGNKITTVEARAFEGLHSLNHIILCDMPTFISIDKEGFHEIPNLTVLSLYNNQLLTNLTLSHLPDEEHTKLQVMEIQSNAFRRLDLDLFINKISLNRVDLTDNPFHCDCTIGWMTEVYHAGAAWASNWRDEGVIPMRCYTPWHLSQFEILLMKSRDFTCQSPVLQEVSDKEVVAFLHSDVMFQAYAFNGIPSTRWLGPQGVVHIPVRPFPESAASRAVNESEADQNPHTAIIWAHEIFNATSQETVVLAQLDMRSVNESFNGTYQLTASNHVTNVTLTFTLHVLPYELTTPSTTTEVFGGCLGMHDKVVYRVLFCVCTYSLTYLFF